MTDYETYKGVLTAATHNLHQVATRYSPDPGFIIPGWLPADTERLLISGPAKAGKSWLAHELVFSLGTGQSFLGVSGWLLWQSTQERRIRSPTAYRSESRPSNSSKR